MNPILTRFKVFIVAGILVLGCLLSIESVTGQTPPPPPPPPNGGQNNGHGLGGNQGPVDAPISNGTEILLILGVIYAGNKVRTTAARNTTA